MSIDVTTFALLQNEIKKSKIDISNASVGQIIKVASVDDAGKPTAWEPVDLNEYSVQYTEQELSEEQQNQARMNLGLYCDKTDFVIGGEIDFTSGESTFYMDQNIFDFTADYYILCVKNSNGDEYVLRGSVGRYMIGPGMYTCNANFSDANALIKITFDEYDGGWKLNQARTMVEDVVSAEIYKVDITKIPVEYLPIDSDFLKIPARSGSGNNSIILNLVGTANGRNSVSEGYNTETNGENSHAEGSNTETNGENSHSEGYYTDASGINQHVQGKYNIKDTNNKYAHIVGNGTWSKRSNAHTLDWDGNAWFAGTVEGTALILKSSTPESTKRFKIMVDDTGTLSIEQI